MSVTQAPVVHLELHTNDLPSAARPLRGAVRLEAATGSTPAHGSYLALDLGRRLGGGIVESATPPAAVAALRRGGDSARPPTARGRSGAALLLAPREGPAGWRAWSPRRSGGELAFWQQKR